MIVSSVFPVTEEEGIAPAQILELNQAIQKMCSDYETVVYLDVYERLSDEEGYLLPEYAQDSVHPTAARYDEWLKVLIPAIEIALIGE